MLLDTAICVLLVLVFALLLRRIFEMAHIDSMEGQGYVYSYFIRHIFS
jgi:hypothetical protein